MPGGHPRARQDALRGVGCHGGGPVSITITTEKKKNMFFFNVDSLDSSDFFNLSHRNFVVKKKTREKEHAMLPLFTLFYFSLQASQPERIRLHARA